MDIGSIQPKAQAWAAVPFYISAAETCQADYTTTIYADNIGEPQQYALRLDLKVEQRPALTMDDLRAYRGRESRA